MKRADVRHVALLRGINVGGKNAVPMKQLVGWFEKAGAKDVVTYIQSGNVVFDAAPDQIESLARRVGASLASATGNEIPLVFRTADELARVVATNPFLARGVAENEVHVAFLRDAPTAQAAARLDASRSPGDALELVGRDLHLHLPNGVGKSKLTNAYLDRTLGTVATLRNWRTVLELHALAGRDR